MTDSSLHNFNPLYITASNQYMLTRKKQLWKQQLYKYLFVFFFPATPHPICESKVQVVMLFDNIWSRNKTAEPHLPTVKPFIICNIHVELLDNTVLLDDTHLEWSLY